MPTFKGQITEHRYTDPEFQTCLKIRMQVFVDEQGFTAEQEDDGLDTDCLHMLALSEDGMPLGTLRFFPPPKGKIGRLAVLKSARGTGAGKALVKALEQAVTSQYGAGTKLSLASQMHAIPFYEQLGFERYGEIFDEDGAPHIMMSKHSV